MNEIAYIEGNLMAIEISRDSYTLLQRHIMEGSDYEFWKPNQSDYWYNPMLMRRRHCHDLLPAVYKFRLIDAQYKERWPVVETANDYLLIESRVIPIMKRKSGGVIPRRNCKSLHVKSKHSIQDLYPSLWTLKGGISDMPPVDYEVLKIKIPKHAVTSFVENAIAKAETCPITTNPIAMETACITSCFHIFETSALRQWLQQTKECPTCREKNPRITEPTK